MIQLVVRADAGPQIGAGHVLRCLSLAMALRDRGGLVHFAMRDPEGYWGKKVTESGFQVHSILCTSMYENIELGREDLQSLISLADNCQAGFVLVDHYGATCSYLEGLHASGLGVAVIDDLADRDLTSADWILNQNFFATKQTFRVRPDCMQLLGTRYALLRPQFARVRREHQRAFEFNDNHILITLGGGDTIQLSRELLWAVEEIARPLEIRCIVNETSSHWDELHNDVQGSFHNIRIIERTNEMAEEMVWADLSINAGGSTCWELMCLGVPMVVMALSDNQLSNAAALVEAGCAKRFNPGDLSALPTIIEKLLGAPELRATMSRRGASLVDGNGAQRAAESLIGVLSDR